MIIYDKKTLDKIKDWDKSNIYILTDFDRTLTIGESVSSWEILSSDDFMPKEYNIERKKLYNKYRPIELDESIDYETKNKIIVEWWEKHINLLVKYKLTEDMITKAIKDITTMKFREGAIDLLGSLYKNDVPVIIMSAGIGNFIEQFLLNNNCYFSNIYIISNFIKFQNGVAVGIDGDILHSLNKREELLPVEILDKIKERVNTILIGDQISDITMINNEKKDKALKIGFCEEFVDENLEYFKNNFDVVCTNGVNFLELKDIFEILS